MSVTTKLRITTITPVTIGSGAELSPYADYVTDNRQIYFIDKKKMIEKIAQKGDSYLDRYVYGVANGMDNNRSAFDLKDFLLNSKIVQSIDELISSNCPFTGNADSKLPIKGIIKSPLAEPYFPGSSIKGALKTVLMYNRLKTNKEGNKTIEKAVNDGNFDLLEKKFEYKEAEIHNKIIQEKVIQQVTDSLMLPKTATIVVDCNRKIPLRFECIAKNQITEFEVTLENYKWMDLAEQANDYAFDCLNRELDIIEKDKKTIHYFNQIADIQDVINEEIGKNNNNTAYFRIGFGKGYYLNSLGIAIYDYVSQKGKEFLYDKFEYFINQQFAKKDRFGIKQEIALEDFPKTRLFVTKTQEPLGWIKVEKMND
jgi:CRISPR-associated protein Csm5